MVDGAAVRAAAKAEVEAASERAVEERAEEAVEAALAKAVEEEVRAGRIRPWTAMDGRAVGVALQEWTRAGVKA